MLSKYPAIVFNGEVYEDEDLAFRIDGRHVARELEFEHEEDGVMAHVRYTVSDNPINPETLEMDMMLYLYGENDIIHDVIPATEWTGFCGWDDKLEVGGHKLDREILSTGKKYCYLEIWFTDEQL